MASKSSNKKTMDVSKPGESAPNTSARPVLVTHRPMVQDPMVKDDSEDKTADTKLTIMSRGNKVVQPVDDASSGEDAIESKPADKTSEAEKPKEPASETEAEKPASETKSSNDEAAVVAAVADQATEDKKKQNKLSDEEKAKQAAIQKLIEEKKYFVPVGQVSRRRNRRALLVLLALAIVLIVGYLVLDAELVDSPLELPLDLIKI